MKGAGGTSGGIGQFFLGLAMICGGGYLLLNAISVTSSFGLGARLYGVGVLGSQWGITGGMIMIPFMFGVGLVFYNSRNVLGWLLAVGSLIALIFGVISSVHFHLRNMTSFDLIVILVLLVGGIGLFLRSLKSVEG